MVPAHAEDGYTLTGTVVNEENKPIPNATVTISGSITPKTLTTDTAGAFNYPYPIKGSGQTWFTAQAVAKGYSYAQAQSSVASDKHITLTLMPEKRLKGKVVDENGRPLAGARIALQGLNVSFSDMARNIYARGTRWESGWDWTSGVIDEVTAGRDGSFVLEHIPDIANRDYCYIELEATAQGRAVVQKTLSSQDGGSTELVTITLPLECTLEGTVHAPDGSTPVTGGIYLSVPGTAGNQRDGRVAAVGNDGKYKFCKLPPGTFSLILNRLSAKDQAGQPTGVKDNWVLPAATGLELTPGKTVTRDLTLQKGVLIKSKVVNAETGEPFKGGSLYLRHGGRPPGTPAELIWDIKSGEFSRYVVPGEVDIYPQNVGEGMDQVGFYDSDPPHLTFTVAKGQDRTDLVFKIDPADGDRRGPGSGRKPIPADLELTPGTYELSWDPELVCSQSIYGKRNYDGDQAKSRMRKLPKLASRRAKFAAVSFDGDTDAGLLCYILDESRGTNKGYDIIYVDANRNLDLTDDKPVKIASDPGQRTSTPWIEVRSHQGPKNGEHAANPVKAGFRVNSYRGNTHVGLTRKGSWKGTIDTNKGKVLFASVDTNANGIYGEPLIIGDDLEIRARGCDMLYAELADGKRLNLDYWGSYNMRPGTVLVAGKLYTVRVNKIGSKITVAPYTGPVGKLLVSADAMKPAPGKVTEYTIVGKSGYYTLEGCDGKPLILPVGKYKVFSGTVSLKRKDGASLDLQCSVPGEYVVKTGKQTVISVGGKPTASGIETGKKVVYLPCGKTGAFSWNIDLDNGAAVTRIQGNGPYGSYSPAVKFIDKSGKNVHTVSASYT